VEKIRAGDAAAFERLFTMYCQPLIRFARRYVQDTGVAENIVQDVFLNIWSNRSRLDPSSKIRTYLYTAVRNQALKHLRHLDVEQRAAERLQPMDHPARTPEHERHDREIAAAVHQSLEALPEKCRIIFSMNRFDHLTYAEIAEIQGISIKTVETQMGRALKFLRKRLAHLL
jgi:RNA polymerase sigma-70 factor (ECF subfamily)